ncbi:hypothetical protein [Paenibacillus cremeus]|uniref:DUF2269 family protein n=1 Tax=Paenibacillus cremeus TaxID=2163881 RepID=A0A559K5N2_9BACL|nr:hypothetical protein [Paenibacillus cremeus]TVY07439.1 hypothetical protein FPZ49_24065 [Paenibacillus cremeus]
MMQVFLYLHVLGAVLMGFYLMLPFLAARVSALPTGAGQYGFLHVLFALNRVGQLALVISFLSGGYLVGKGSYPVVWMVLAVVLLLAIGALSGIVGKRMRLALADPSGSKIKEQLGSIRTLSTIIGILFFLTITLMKFPNVF